MLVFLPGLICDSRVFAPQKAAFPDALYVEGYGMADALPEMARQVLSLADEGGAETLELFGHSMGGRVAMEIVRLAPDRVSRLALASCGVFPATPDEPEKRAALQRIGYEQGWEALIDRWMKVLVPREHREADWASQMRAMCLAKDQALFDAHNAALLARPPFAELLKHFTGRVLSITGEDDRMAPVAEHERIADEAPQSSLHVVEGAGHLITLEAADEVNTAIARWLA